MTNLQNCKSSVEASGLLSCWVSSLFLVTAVPKLPSTGALWHAAAGLEQSRGRRSREPFFFPKCLLHPFEHAQIGFCVSFKSAK